MHKPVSAGNEAYLHDHAVDRSLHALLQRIARPHMTLLLIAVNVLVFLAMVLGSAGLWDTPGDVQLAWGANFGPATQDGEWWRLGSAMFIHFGMLHLAFNMWALWDGGHLVERMYGHLRFAMLYLASGLVGNLLSLVVQGNEAVSGGASGAIFGVYGALLVFLWHARRSLHVEEFRWLFWGALAFSSISIALGFLIPGIDNSAHIGGFVTGVASGVLLAPTQPHTQKRRRLIAGGALLLAILALIARIPEPKYRWSEEIQVREEIARFVREEQAIKRSWYGIVQESEQGEATFDELAGHIDSEIGDRYEGSFEQLSQLPLDPALPSAPALENILQYVQHRRDASRALAQELRAKSDGVAEAENKAMPENMTKPGTDKPRTMPH
jgi:rhomboid protease GluP